MTNPESSTGEVTRLLNAWRGGDSAAFENLIPLIYRELHNLAVWQMRGEVGGHTLSPTALLHESFLKLVRSGPGQEFQDRKHFFLVAARSMRQLLIDHARRKHASKRRQEPAGSEEVENPAPWNVVDLDRALQRLEAEQPRRAKIVELRHFAGMTVREIGDILEISAATISRELRVAEAWLAQAIKARDC